MAVNTQDRTPAYVQARLVSGVDVATTSTAVVAADADAVMIELVNGSDSPIWIAFGTSGSPIPTAVVGTGVYLAAYGGAYTGYYNGAVAAIGTQSSGTKRLGIIRW